MNKCENHIYIIFGATGDLTKRKLLPALFSLYVQKLLPNKFILLGVSRSQLSDEDFRNKTKSALEGFRETDDLTKIDDFIMNVFYNSIDFDDLNSYKKLKKRINKLQNEYSIESNIIFYLSTPPSLYGTIPVHLSSVGLNNQTDGWKRLIIEKPFGYDYGSAINLKNLLLESWEEEQIYRIDHYLGKETVQNLLVTRFSNGIFEPLWNRNFIHHVEITSAESIGVEQRGGYYDTSGALRDMVQNHLMQIVGLVGMEPPSSLEPVAIRNEILKVLQSIRRFTEEDVKQNCIRGQYLSAKIKDEIVAGYREEKGVRQNTYSETFIALKLYIDNWRWGKVPFYIRTGKRLPLRVTEIVIHFKETPHFLFSYNKSHNQCNQLVIRIQPDEGVLLNIGMKIPGSGFEVQNVNMDFHYSDLTPLRIPSAYERLLYDAIKGDSTLFARTDEVLESWKILAPIIDCWKNGNDIPLYGYPAGTWGPLIADELIEGKNMKWRYPCRNLSNDGIYCEL